MATFKKTNLTFATGDRGTNFKKVVEWIVENSSFEILETVSDTASSYSAYIYAHEDKSVIIKLTSGSNIAILVYISHQNGSTTIAGQKYIALMNNSSVGLNISAGNSGTIGVAEGEGLCSVFIGKTTVYISTLVDFATGSEIKCGGSSRSIIAYIMKNGAIYSLDAILPPSITNGLILATELTAYSTAAGFWGSFKDAFWAIKANDSDYKNVSGTEISVGGHKFVQVSSEINYPMYLKID